MRAAVGFGVHTGWAVAVVVGDGDGGAAVLLARERLELIDRAERFVYHLAAEHGDGARRVREAARAARARATAALRELVGRCRVTVAAVPRAKRVLPGLDVILAAHPLIHAAEGELYRAALEDACGALGLALSTAPALAPDVGKPGPPWGKDQRDAAALAWGALTG